MRGISFSLLSKRSHHHRLTRVPQEAVDAMRPFVSLSQGRRKEEENGENEERNSR